MRAIVIKHLQTLSYCDNLLSVEGMGHGRARNLGVTIRGWKVGGGGRIRLGNERICMLINLCNHISL